MGLYVLCIDDDLVYFRAENVNINIFFCYFLRTGNGHVCRELVMRVDILGIYNKLLGFIK